MRHEISTLRSNAMKSPSSSGLLTPQHNLSPALEIHRVPPPASPISPVSQPSSYSYPTFIQGSSNQPYSAHQSFDDAFQTPPHQEIMAVETPASSVTPSPSPQLTFVQPSQLHHEFSASPVNRRKRRTAEPSSDEDDSTSDSSISRNGRPSKRSNHHDKRCLTIHVSATLHPIFTPNILRIACHTRTLIARHAP